MTLDTEIFDNMLIGFSVKPDIDLFASRINYKCKKSVSYQPDPGAYAVDAFHLTWILLLCFPPFLHYSESIEKSNSRPGPLVVPHWPTQPSWPLLTHLLMARPFILPRRKDTLYLASKPEEHHPLHKTLTLLGYHLSEDSLLVKDFQRQLPVSSSKGGERAPGNSMHRTSSDGNCTVVNGKLIHFLRL